MYNMNRNEIIIVLENLKRDFKLCRTEREVLEKTIKILKDEVETDFKKINMDLWHKIFKKYLDDYFAIHKLNKDGIIDDNTKHALLSKLIDNIMTTFESEINE